MSRRKGEQPVPQRLQRWSDDHPVARAMRDGDRWFYAWLAQMATPLAKLAKRTGMPVNRLIAIDQGDALSRTELGALARAWSVSAGDLETSIAGAAEIID